MLWNCKKCQQQLLQEFYKGGTVPLALHQFLYQIWTHAKHLAGYVQQDAHEFFIAILNVLHTHCLESVTPQKMISVCGSERCPCIIDQIFSGYLQSDLNCQKCKWVPLFLNIPFYKAGNVLIFMLSKVVWVFGTNKNLVVQNQENRVAHRLVQNLGVLVIFLHGN